MKFKTTKIIDFFLLQKDFYSKLTDKNMWLYIGIALVGIRDVVLGVAGTNINPTDKLHVVLNMRTAAILFVTALIMGLIDVLCFSYPVFDIIKHFKKRSDSNSISMGMSYSSLLTKVMKVYIVVNIIVTPLNILGYYTAYAGNVHQSVILMYIAAVLDILAYFWFNGAITRGLCVLFKLGTGTRGLVFVLVFLWNALLSSAIGYLFTQVLTRL